MQTPAAFKGKWLGDHCDSQNPHFLGNIGNHRRRTGAGATTHTGSNKQHIGTLDDLGNPVTIFLCCLASNIRVCTGTQTFGDISSDLQRGACCHVFQGLRIGIRTDEFHTVDIRLHHMLHGVTTTATNTDHLDYCTLST